MLAYLRSIIKPHMHQVTQDYLEKHNIVVVSIKIWMHVILVHFDPLLAFLLVAYVVSPNHHSQIRFTGNSFRA